MRAVYPAVVCDGRLWICLPVRDRQSTAPVDLARQTTAALQSVWAAVGAAAGV